MKEKKTVCLCKYLLDGIVAVGLALFRLASSQLHVECLSIVAQQLDY